MGNIATLFPPDKHQELISAVCDAAAKAGEPMSKQEALAIARAEKESKSLSTINSTQVDENQRHSMERRYDHYQ